MELSILSVLVHLDHHAEGMGSYWSGRHCMVDMFVLLMSRKDGVGFMT